MDVGDPRRARLTPRRPTSRPAPERNTQGRVYELEVFAGEEGVAVRLASLSDLAAPAPEPAHATEAPGHIGPGAPAGGPSGTDLPFLSSLGEKLQLDIK
jgi:hypothetical protein